MPGVYGLVETQRKGGSGGKRKAEAPNMDKISQLEDPTKGLMAQSPYHKVGTWVIMFIERLGVSDRAPHG